MRYAERTGQKKRERIEHSEGDTSTIQPNSLRINIDQETDKDKNQKFDEEEFHGLQDCSVTETTLNYGQEWSRRKTELQPR
mmetsp:Transcript_34323/g.52712  ORF Transcript_34323/g.52712 Transcript_34323/m.52712 type:complete len:81 (+) Transcript_34323:682-924(+)